MGSTFNYKILVAEEFCLINFELKFLLKQQGFNVIETSDRTDFMDTVKKQSPDFIITCQANLKKIADEINTLKSILVTNDYSITDTVILDNRMHPLMRYHKPYNAKDMINYITERLNIN